MTNYLLISGLMSLTVLAMNYVMHLFKITNYRIIMGGDGSPNYCVKALVSRVILSFIPLVRWVIFASVIITALLSIFVDEATFKKIFMVKS